MKLSNRSLFTGDCTYLFVDHLFNPGGGPYTAKLFHDHIARLAASGIDTYLCNPQAQGNWWPSRRMPTVFDGYRKGDREFVRSYAPNSEATIDSLVRMLDHHLELMAAGIDWVAECARACRKHGISPWLTIRMNDMHGSGNPECFFNSPVFRNPANRLQGRWIVGEPPHLNSYFGGMNYLRPAVREFMLGTIGELVEEYDFEGIELDWLRNPLCCEPNATQAQIDQITAFHADIRTLTVARAKATGRPYPLGVRVPPAFDLLRSIGLDVPAMARAGLLDFVSPSNFFQTSWDLPYDKFRAALGPDVTIYGVTEVEASWVKCLDPKTGRQSCRHQPLSPELLRGNVAGKLAMGVDGIEHFNFFVADEIMKERRIDYGLLKDLPNMAVLRGQPKQYTFSSILGGVWAPPYEQSEQIPVVLEPRWRRQFRVSMCSEPADAGILVVQVVLENKATLPVLGVRFNECWPSFEGEPTDQLLFPAGDLTHHVPEHQAYNYRFPVTAIREGWNEIELFDPRPEGGTARVQHEQAVHVVNLDLAVVPVAAALWPTVRRSRDLSRWEWHVPCVASVTGPEDVASALAQSAVRTIRHVDRLVAEIKLGASDQGLLFLGRFHEPGLRPNLTQPWFGTGFELLVPHGTGREAPGDAKSALSQVFLVPRTDGRGADGLRLAVPDERAEPAPGISVIAQPLAGGCEVSAFIPWSQLGFESLPAETQFKLIVDVFDPTAGGIVQVLAFEAAWEGWGPVEGRLVTAEPA
jgi:hypothetical protein